MTTSKPSFPEKSVGTVLIAVTGPLLVWALHFGIVYGMQSLFCDVLGGHSAGLGAQTAVLAATVAALLVLLLLIVKPGAVLRMQRSEISRPFLAGVLRLLALLSFFGVLWGGSAAFFLPACMSFA